MAETKDCVENEVGRRRGSNSRIKEISIRRLFLYLKWKTLIAMTREVREGRKWSDPQVILKMELIEFLIGWIWGVKEREASRMSSRFGTWTTERIELPCTKVKMLWVKKIVKEAQEVGGQGAEMTIRNSVWDKVDLKRLLESQVEIPQNWGGFWKSGAMQSLSLLTRQ